MVSDQFGLPQMVSFAIPCPRDDRSWQPKLVAQNSYITGLLWHNNNNDDDNDDDDDNSNNNNNNNNSNCNTQIAVIALPPSTMHPQLWP